MGTNLLWQSRLGATRSAPSANVVANGALFFFFPCLLQSKEWEGVDAVTGHIISATISEKNGEPKRVSYDSLAVCLCVAPMWASMLLRLCTWSGSACLVPDLRSESVFI